MFNPGSEVPVPLTHSSIIMPVNKESIKKWINIVITILTAIASSLFVQSCCR